MKSRSLLVVLAVTVGGVSNAAPRSYPSRPITMVVPFAAGGPVDTIARIVAVPMGKALGQAVVIASTTGAAGSEAHVFVMMIIGEESCE